MCRRATTNGGARGLYLGAVAIALLATAMVTAGALGDRGGVMRSGLALSSVGCVACLVAVIGFNFS